MTRLYVCEQFLIEKITRQKIQGDAYWKEFCFALTAETIVDRAMELDHIGGVYGGNMKPTAFIQLILKLLQIQPEKEIIVEFIKNEDFKYVRALGAFYMRMVGKPLDVYQYLEPLLNDYRKLRVITGGEEASHAKRDTRFPERMAWAVRLRQTDRLTETEDGDRFARCNILTGQSQHRDTRSRTWTSSSTSC